MAMRSIGATISLGGESEFKRSVQACNTSLRTMRSEMNLVTERYRGQANSLEALRAKHDVLERTLERSTTLQTELERALANSQTNYRNAGTQLEGYQRQLREATSALEALERQQSESADDSIAQQIEEQRTEMERLTDMVARGERAYAQAGNNVQNWERQLNDARTQVVRLQREMDETNGYIDEASNSADHCATSINEMGRRIQTSAGNTSEAVEELTDDVTSFFTTDKLTEYAEAVSESFQQIAQAAYQALQDLDEGYDTILTKTGASGDALAEFTGIADEIYGDLPASMADIGTAIGEVNTRFGTTGKELDALSRKFLMFSNINGTDLNGSIDGVQAAMASFNMEAKDASKVLDVMNKAGQNTGISMDALQSSLLQNASAFREMGMDIYESVDFVSKLEKSGIDASQVMAGLKKAYQSSAKEGKSFRDSLADIQEALLNSENSTSANKRAVELFGKSYGNIATAVRDGRLDFENIAKSMDLLQESTNNVDDTFNDSLDTWDEMGVAINNLKTIGGRMMSDIMDIASPFVSTLADGLALVRDGLDALPDPIRKTVSAVTLIGGTVGIVGPKLFALAQNIRTLANANGVTSLSGLASAITGVGTASAGATASTATFGTAVRSVVTKLGPYVAIIAGATMAIKALNDGRDEHVAGLLKEDKALAYAIDSVNRYTEKLSELKEAMTQTTGDATDIISEFGAKRDIAQPLVQSLEDLQSQSNKTNTDVAVMSATVDELNAVFPDLNLEVDKNTGAFKANGQAINDLSKYLDNYMNKAEKAAKEKVLQELYEKKYQAEVEFAPSLMKREELEKQMDAILKEAGTTFEEFQKKNGFSQWSIASGLFNGVDSAMFAELYHEWNGLVDAQNDLNEEYKKNEEQIKAVRDEIERTDASLKNATDSTNENAKSWTGAGVEVDRAAQKYVDLGVKIKENNGDIQAVANALGEEESALKELFESTCVVWQQSHDKIMSGLGEEVQSLASNMGQWEAYKEQVKASVESVSSMFSLREQDEKKSWQAMRDGLVSNANAYDLWNANVSAILESARYQTDESFREIANRIMTAGIDSADYLDSFVQHVDLTTTQAKSDIAEFADLGGETELYASNMANLKSATEDSMSGIAQVFDATKSAAQQSLEELSNSLNEKSEEYTQYSTNAKGLVESERYKTDEAFRTMVNTMLQQGMAGAGMIQELWTAMQDGNGAVDELLGSFLNFETSMGGFADVTASVKTSLQNDMGDMVTIVDNSGEAFKIAMMNDEILMASGMTGEHLNSAVSGAIDKTLADMCSTESLTKAEETGEEIGKAIASGVDEGISGIADIVKEYDGTGPVASLLHPMQYKNSVTNNMNLTVNQKDNGNWFGEITDWIRRQLS